MHSDVHEYLREREKISWSKGVKGKADSQNKDIERKMLEHLFFLSSYLVL